jgi:hypothetical protein
MNEDRLNEAAHAILREAADRRAERERVRSTQDEAEARQASGDLLSLARASGRRS